MLQGSAPPRDGRSARWESHRLSRRDELARRARHAIHDRGPELSMDEIAVALETSKSILYRYFTDKLGLQQAVGQQVLGRMRSELDEASQQVGGPREQIRAMVTVYLDQIALSPHVYAFVTRSGGPAGATLAGFVAEVDDLVAEVLLPAVLGVASDEVADAAEVAPESRAQAALWASGAVGTVRAVAERWMASTATATATTATPGGATGEGTGPGLDDPAAERAIASVSRDQLAAWLTTWLWDGAAGVARRARGTAPRTPRPTEETDTA